MKTKHKLNTLVSVNIRTFNSQKTIIECLDSVKKQDYQNIEVLISDGNSTDKTVEIAKKYGIKINYAKKLGDARHQNYLLSQGKYIISLDSDQVLDSGLIKDCVRICEEEKLDGLIIAEKSLVKRGTFLEKLIAYDKWVIDQVKDTNVVFGTVCPRFFKKVLFKEINWPKDLGVFDDTLLYNQLIEKGAKIGYISSQVIWHYEVTSWINFIKKFHRYGKSYPGAFKENPTTIAAHSLPRRSYFSKAAFSNPIYFLGLVLLYFVKAASALSGVIAYFFEDMNEKV